MNDLTFVNLKCSCCLITLYLVDPKLLRKLILLLNSCNYLNVSKGIYYQLYRILLLTTFHLTSVSMYCDVFTYVLKLSSFFLDRTVPFSLV